VLKKIGIILIVMGLVSIGCGGGGGGVAPLTPTPTGTPTAGSFSLHGYVYAPPSGLQGQIKALQQNDSDIGPQIFPSLDSVPQGWKAVAGVIVKDNNTGVEDTTDENGYFELPNLSPSNGKNDFHDIMIAPKEGSGFLTTIFRMLIPNIGDKTLNDFASLVILPEDAIVDVGGFIQFFAYGIDKNGLPFYVAPEEITWSVNGSAATITPTGLLKGIEEGVGGVVATAITEEGSLVGYSSVRVIDPQNAASLRGKVSDTNGNPIAGATLYIGGVNYGVETDSNGKYLFPRVPTGMELTVIVINEGYLVASVKTGPLNPGENTLDITVGGGESQEIKASGTIIYMNVDEGVYEFMDSDRGEIYDLIGVEDVASQEDIAKLKNNPNQPFEGYIEGVLKANANSIGTPVEVTVVKVGDPIIPEKPIQLVGEITYQAPASGSTAEGKFFFTPTGETPEGASTKQELPTYEVTNVKEAASSKDYQTLINNPGTAYPAYLEGFLQIETPSTNANPIIKATYLILKNETNPAEIETEGLVAYIQTTITDEEIFEFTTIDPVGIKSTIYRLFNVKEASPDAYNFLKKHPNQRYPAYLKGKILLWTSHQSKDYMPPYIPVEVEVLVVKDINTPDIIEGDGDISYEGVVNSEDVYKFYLDKKTYLLEGVEYAVPQKVVEFLKNHTGERFPAHLKGYLEVVLEDEEPIVYVLELKVQIGEVKTLTGKVTFIPNLDWLDEDLVRLCKANSWLVKSKQITNGDEEWGIFKFIVTSGSEAGNEYVLIGVENVLSIDDLLAIMLLEPDTYINCQVKGTEITVEENTKALLVNEMTLFMSDKSKSRSK